MPEHFTVSVVRVGGLVPSQDGVLEACPGAEARGDRGDIEVGVTLRRNPANTPKALPEVLEEVVP